MDFIHSNLLADYTMATEVKKIDLPVNPLSYLLLNVSGFNATDEATLAEILAFINKIEVTHLGTSIISLQSEDLFMENLYLYGHEPVLTHNIADDNATREITLVIPFGRRIFDPDECFPATKKGELTLSLDTTVPSSSLDNAIINIESLELPGAQPTRYLKSTQLSITAPGDTGDNDIDLPIGNPIVNLILYTTTVPGASSHTYGIQSAKILVDNVEKGYSMAHFNCLKGERIFHQSTLPRDIAAFGNIQLPNYAFLDFDPAKDGKFALETAGKSSVKLRLNMGVDEASKVSIMELVDVH